MGEYIDHAASTVGVESTRRSQLVKDVRMAPCRFDLLHAFIWPRLDVKSLKENIAIF